MQACKKAAGNDPSVSGGNRSRRSCGIGITSHNSTELLELHDYYIADKDASHNLRLLPTGCELGVPL